MPAIAYATAVGLGVNAGRADLTRHASAVPIYVGSGGSDANNGSTHALRKLTLASAIAAVRQGFGDHILLAKGQTFNDPCASDMTNRGGLSASYPTVVQTYDTADPTNAAKFGLVASVADMATINITDTTGATNGGTSALSPRGGSNTNHIAYRGLYIKMNADDDSTTTGNITAVGAATTPASNILFERCIFDRVGISANMGFGKSSAFGNGSQYYPGAASNWIFRNCGFLNAWRTSFYISGISSAVIEDCVFWHCGWKAGVTDRTTAVGSGGPVALRHNLYCNWDSSGICRRTVSLEPSYDSFGLRGDWVSEHNVSLSSPSHFRLGNGNLNGPGDGWTGTGLSPSAATEGGYYFPIGFLRTNFRCLALGNVIEGAGGSYYGFGAWSRYTRPGSGFEECIFGAPGANTVENVLHQDTAPDSMANTNVDYKNCLIVGYSNSYGTNSGGTSTSDNNATFDPVRSFSGVNYIQGATVDANRVSNAGLTMPNQYTAASLVATLGDASVAAAGLRMSQSPWLGHAKALLTTGFAGYGRTLNAALLP